MDPIFYRCTQGACDLAVCRICALELSKILKHKVKVKSHKCKLQRFDILNKESNDPDLTEYMENKLTYTWICSGHDQENRRECAEGISQFGMHVYKDTFFQCVEKCDFRLCVNCVLK